MPQWMWIWIGGKFENDHYTASSVANREPVEHDNERLLPTAEHVLLKYMTAQRTYAPHRRMCPIAYSACHNN